MDIVVKHAEKQPYIELGDLIAWGDSFYLVCYTGRDVTARNLDGTTNLFGDYISIDALNKAYYKRLNSTLKGATIYKAKDYQLQLVKK